MNSFLRSCAVASLVSMVAAAPAKQGKRMQPGQIAQLTIVNADGAGSKVIYQTDEVIEAPNWTPDGKTLVFNSNESLWRISVEGGEKPQRIDTGDIKKINNDHALSPDGKTAYFSSNGHIYAVPIDGGKPRRITNEHPGKFIQYLHGVSPDNKTLAYVAVTDDGADIFTIPVAGGADIQLTKTKAHEDGPEYTPDGKWINFNSDRGGHDQVWRMKPDGSGAEELTHDERVNWFPHISPDGQWIVYLSFPPGTTAHPANKDVILRRMRLDGSESTDILKFFGGQGTINVNSWSPDSKRFAFVAFPIKAPAAQ